MRDIRIKITKEHIRKGVRGSACECPIALALKETLITNNVHVDMDGMRVNHVSYALDKKDRKFIERFDAGMPVRPYDFDLGR